MRGLVWLWSPELCRSRGLANVPTASQRRCARDVNIKIIILRAFCLELRAHHARHFVMHVQAVRADRRTSGNARRCAKEHHVAKKHSFLIQTKQCEPHVRANAGKFIRKPWSSLSTMPALCHNRSKFAVLCERSCSRISLQIVRDTGAGVSMRMKKYRAVPSIHGCITETCPT